MENLHIEDGSLEITINGDPQRVIRFNPADVVFTERFFRLVEDFSGRLVEYEQRAKAIDANTGKDALGLPANIPDGLALLREFCEETRKRIDAAFGAGTSQKAFGDTLSLSAIMQFFGGIAPFIQAERDAKVNQYLAPATRKKAPRATKTMK